MITYLVTYLIIMTAVMTHNEFLKFTVHIFFRFAWTFSVP